MSYEGFVQVLCAQGHVDVFDAYDDERSERCQEVLDTQTMQLCGAEWAERNSVDETNGCEGNPCICGEKDLEVIEPPVVETCNLGHKHEVKPGRYKFGKVGCHVPQRVEE